MHKFIPLIIAGGMLAMISCSDKKSNSESTGNTTPEPTPTVNQTQEATPAVQPAPVEITPSAQTPVVVQPGANQVTAVPVTGDQSGLNPAHGQPNHRCDIAVGAPLSSPPGPNAQAAPASGTVQLPNNQQGAVTQQVQFQDGTTGSTPNSIMSTPAPSTGATTSTAPGMNPPHGQPGHDCSIAVGAPLKK